MSTLEKIQSLIESRGLNPTNFAIEVGLSKNIMSEWKKGRIKPSVDAIVKIAKYFNVSADYLLGLEEKTEIQELFDKLNAKEQAMALAYMQGLIDKTK